jgi:hypothetical protein
LVYATSHAGKNVLPFARVSLPRRSPGDLIALSYLRDHEGAPNKTWPT